MIHRDHGFTHVTTRTQAARPSTKSHETGEFRPRHEFDVRLRAYRTPVVEFSRSIGRQQDRTRLIAQSSYLFGVVEHLPESEPQLGVLRCCGERLDLDDEHRTVRSHLPGRIDLSPQHTQFKGKVTRIATRFSGADFTDKAVKIVQTLLVPCHCLLRQGHVQFTKNLLVLFLRLTGSTWPIPSSVPPEDPRSL